MSDLSSHYDNWHSVKDTRRVKKSEAKSIKLILDTLGVKQKKRLLDLGCGKGSFCGPAFDRGLEVYGVDFSQVALKQAKASNDKINYILSDAQTLPFKDGFFDYVVCLGSLEHFSNKKTALQEISRILAKNGKIYMFLPNSYFIGHIYMVWKTGTPPDEAGQQFSEDFNTKLGWKSMLEENGFKVVSVDKFNTIWASAKVSGFTKYFYNFVIKPFIPFNLSYSFGYLCLKK